MMSESGPAGGWEPGPAWWLCAACRPERFAMAIANTSWWKRTPQGRREWITKRITDPATARRDRINGRIDVRNRAQLLGVPKPTNKQAEAMWLTGQLRGYDDDALNVHIFKQAKWKNNLDRFQRSSGRYGQLLNEMLEQAYDYGFIRTGNLKNAPNTLSKIARHAGDIMRAGGTADNSAWLKELKSFAATRYSGFRERIMAGETVADIASPYRQAIAETLEISEDELGLNDKLLNKALTDKEPWQMWRVEQEARRDGRWSKTQNAMEAAAQTATTIGESFGMIAR
jgi:hypothetical protein